ATLPVFGFLPAGFSKGSNSSTSCGFENTSNGSPTGFSNLRYTRLPVVGDRNEVTRPADLRSARPRFRVDRLTPRSCRRLVTVPTSSRASQTFSPISLTSQVGSGAAVLILLRYTVLGLIPRALAICGPVACGYRWR